MVTIAQERVAQIVAKQVREGKNPSVSRAMRESGMYSPHVAKMPERVTKSPSWKKLMEKYLPDHKLAEVHAKFFDKKEIVIVGDGKGESHWEKTGQPHPDALKALDLAYKLKNKIPKEDGGGNKNLVLVITGESASRYNVLPGQVENK